ncbi:hypothetical protein CC79DRAFT_1368640 [Sarocladium strictum]
MSNVKLILALMAVAGVITNVGAQQSSTGDLILCDCGIGDNPENVTWSTSRQINWYDEITWPNSAKEYPDPPDEAVEVPYEDGTYPWTLKGVTSTLPGGEVWTVYIEKGTPDGHPAGYAVSSKDEDDSLTCWAYRGRPISAAINKTITDDAICWTAFVCNSDDEAPSFPDDMTSPTTTAESSSAPPSTTFVSETPPTSVPSDGGEPAPTESPKTGELFVSSAVNPRFINWESTWEHFINKFVWDKTTGRCVSDPIQTEGFNITIDCAGIQLDEDSHMTLLLIQALRDVGANSLWFNQNPTLPEGTKPNSTAPHWVVMPEAFSLTATDVAHEKVVGYISYKTTYDGFLTGPCSTCEPKRFDKNFFDPIIAAMQGSYPTFNSFTVQGECKPWTVCK